MGEPYDGDPCPACGSDYTFSYLARTRHEIGYGSQCGTCGTVWELLPAADEDDLDMLMGCRPQPLRPPSPPPNST